MGYFRIKKIPAIFTDGGDHNNNNLTLMNCNFYPSIDRGKSGIGIFFIEESKIILIVDFRFPSQQIAF